MEAKQQEINSPVSHLVSIISFHEVSHDIRGLIAVVRKAVGQEETTHMSRERASVCTCLD